MPNSSTLNVCARRYSIAGSLTSISEPASRPNFIDMLMNIPASKRPILLVLRPRLVPFSFGAP
jgi:hypothetical protein